MTTAFLDVRSTRATAIADLDWLDRRERMPASRGGAPRGAWRSLVARLQWGPVGTAWTEPCGASLDDALHVAPPAAGSPLDAVVRALASPWRAWRRERRIAAGIDALPELDDHLLRDLGIERGDIERAAHGLPLARRR